MGCSMAPAQRWWGASEHLKHRDKFLSSGQAAAALPYLQEKGWDQTTTGWGLLEWIILEVFYPLASSGSIDNDYSIFPKSNGWEHVGEDS